MSTYIALVQPAEKETFSTDRATQTIKDGTAAAARHGVKIKNLYLTSGACNAVLVLQAADQHGIADWRDSLNNLRVQLMPVLDSMTQMTTDQWGSSCDMIHWWY
ncbi:MAG: hypothetical protein WCH75_04735 [Candidatus Binatia bacterium]